MKDSNSSVFYPEMGQAPNPKVQLISCRLHSRFKITCVGIGEIKETRSIEYQYTNKNDQRVYYATEAGLDSLEKKYSVAYESLLD